MSQFKELWKHKYGDEEFVKAALTEVELVRVQKKIDELQKIGKPSSVIITALQKMIPKLSLRWKAERAYWTEVKKMDTTTVVGAAEELGVEKFKVILSPNPCPLCKKETNNGSRVFKGKELQKNGREVPPFHPNCYCIALPI